jgi:hypothetical protein
MGAYFNPGDKFFSWPLILYNRLGKIFIFFGRVFSEGGSLSKKGVGKGYFTFSR